MPSEPSSAIVSKKSATRSGLASLNNVQLMLTRKPGNSLGTLADQVLGYMVYGPWKDPAGFNFPQTITFLKSTQVPKLMPGFRVNIGLIIALLAVGAFWVLLFRTYAGFQLQVGGLAPAAARYAGFSSRRALWRSCSLLRSPSAS